MQKEILANKKKSAEEENQRKEKVKEEKEEVEVVKKYKEDVEKYEHLKNKKLKSVKEDKVNLSFFISFLQFQNGVIKILSVPNFMSTQELLLFACIILSVLLVIFICVLGGTLKVEMLSFSLVLKVWKL